MCVFFSFLTDGEKKMYYFTPEQRKAHVTYRNGQKINNYDSHTAIANFYGLREDDWSRGEYNPYTNTLVIDQQHTTWDDVKVCKMLDAVDWRGLCGDLDGARKFIAGIKEISYMRPDGTLTETDKIKVFDTKNAAIISSMGNANDAAWRTARDAAVAAAVGEARDAAMSEAWNIAKDIVKYVVLDTVSDTAREAAWNTAYDAVMDAVLFVCVLYVCDGLDIEEKHREHAKLRMDVWKHGYGVCCDVDGVLYCYKRI